MMTMFALMLAMTMLFVYLKSLKNLFKSQREIEDNFNNKMKEIVKEQGYEVMVASLMILAGIYCLFVLIVYTITASVIGTPLMLVLASLLIIRNVVTTWKLLDTFISDDKNGVYRMGRFDRMFSLVGFVYIILFFYLFFN